MSLAVTFGMTPGNIGMSLSIIFLNTDFIQTPRMRIQTVTG